MAYSRYDRKCDWYIFWETTEDIPTNEKYRQRLAVWHVDFRSSSPFYDYLEIKQFLDTNNFNEVPGFVEKDKDLVKKCFTEFITDVDKDFC